MTNIQELLDIEVQQNFWQTTVAGLHLWPLIRHSIYQEALWSDLPFHLFNSALAYYHPKLWRTHLRTLPLFIHTPSDASHSILVFKSSLTRIGNYDRLYDPYFQQFENALVFENWSYNDVHKTFRGGDYSDNMLRIIVAALSKPFQVSKIDQTTAEDFARHVIDCFGLPIEKLSKVTKTMVNRIQRNHLLPELIERFIAPRVQSKLALVHHAASMGYDSLVTKTLHELGFIVAEVEHGTVHPLYADYQYSQLICDDSQHPSRKYLPDVFLTFGKFWSKSANVPFKTLEIGYPHLTEKVAEIEAQIQLKPKQILIISQSTFSTTSAELAEQLAKAFPDKSIVIKLHPLYESPDMSHFETLEKYQNIHIIQNADIYQLIAASAILIGFYSTVIYEALAFSGKRIFVQKNPRVSEMIGTLFESSEELVELLKNPDAGHAAVESSWFWEPDWRRKLAAFEAEQFTAERKIRGIGTMVDSESL